MAQCQQIKDYSFRACEVAQQVKTLTAHPKDLSLIHEDYTVCVENSGLQSCPLIHSHCGMHVYTYTHIHTHTQSNC